VVKQTAYVHSLLPLCRHPILSGLPFTTSTRPKMTTYPLSILQTRSRTNRPSSNSLRFDQARFCPITLTKPDLTRLKPMRADYPDWDRFGLIALTKSDRARLGSIMLILARQGSNEDIRHDRSQITRCTPITPDTARTVLITLDRT
jgi:hypothetical protein